MADLDLQKPFHKLSPEQAVKELKSDIKRL